MAEPATPQKRCTHCSGKMAWDAGQKSLRCESCGASRVVVGGDEIREHDLRDGVAKRGRLGAGQQQLKCEECGAVVEFPEGIVATKCNFCDSSHVLPQVARDDLLVPESLIAFGVGRDAAVAAFKGWLAKRWFRPSDLKHKADVSELHGVYVPYWTFDTQVSSTWSADAGYYYYTTETYTDPQGNTQTRQVQHTRWEPASGSRYDNHEDHLVCASKGLPEKLAGKVAVFDMGGLVGYSGDYLQGFSAESYAIVLDDGWKRARHEISAMQDARCRGDVPGNTQRHLRASHSFSYTTFKHVLLPIWIAAFRYRDKVYRFLVNGQSGRVSGEAPLSWTKILIFIGAIAAAIAAIVFFFVSR